MRPGGGEKTKSSKGFGTSILFEGCGGHALELSGELRGAGASLEGIPLRVDDAVPEDAEDIIRSSFLHPPHNLVLSGKA